MNVLKIDSELSEEFPGLSAKIVRIKGFEVKKKDPKLEKFKAKVIYDTKKKWTFVQLREHPLFRSYRDFFWRIGIDPTKTRPAAEALIRRVLHGHPIPNINTFVDAYNIASIKTAIALAAFNLDELRGEILMRKAEKGEKFLGIGMNKPQVLRGGEVVVTDDEKLIAIYPYRDAETSKIKMSTKRAMILVCGVPNIKQDALSEVGYIVIKYVTRFCGGQKI